MYVIPRTVSLSVPEPNVRVDKEDLLEQWREGCNRVYDDHYILLSNRVRGPFVPRWSDLSWTEIIRGDETTRRKGEPYVVTSPHQVDQLIEAYDDRHPYESIFCRSHPLLDIITICHDKLDNGVGTSSLAMLYYHRSDHLPPSSCPENDALRIVNSRLTDDYIETLQPLTTPSGYFLTDLNLSLGYGLTNQLQVLVVSIWIAVVMRRNLVVTGFYPDYNINDRVPLRGDLREFEAEYKER